VDQAVLWLKQGDWARGWTEYEWRWRLPGMRRRRLSRPMWDGRPLAGRRILLHPEQGLGDTLQFVRYAAVLQAAGAHVIVESPRSLTRLLSRCAGIDELVPAGTPLPDYDVHAPLLSLPRLLETQLTNIPAQVPYLNADPVGIERWRERLIPYCGLKIGIAWQGNPRHPNDHQRSMPLHHFAPLAKIPGVQLFSLQKQFGTQQLAGVASHFSVIDLVRRADRRAGPFMDTAAIMKNLDLVITCDTAIAHLAGALAVPVWVLLAANSSDWRWGYDTSRSPWYPTLRLFRQPQPGNWQETFQRVAAALTRPSTRAA
jgi:hypothetical protein